MQLGNTTSRSSGHALRQLLHHPMIMRLVTEYRMHQCVCTTLLAANLYKLWWLSFALHIVANTSRICSSRTPPVLTSTCDRLRAILWLWRHIQSFKWFLKPKLLLAVEARVEASDNYRLLQWSCCGVVCRDYIRAGLSALRQWMFWSRQWIFWTYYVTYSGIPGPTSGSDPYASRFSIANHGNPSLHKMNLYINVFHLNSNGGVKLLCKKNVF